ncbi:Dixin, partial [Armadillidium nasatum]
NFLTLYCYSILWNFSAVAAVVPAVCVVVHIVGAFERVVDKNDYVDVYYVNDVLEEVEGVVQDGTAALVVAAVQDSVKIHRAILAAEEVDMVFSLEQQQQQVQPYHLEQLPLPLQEHHSHNIHQHNHFYQQLSQKHQQCEQQHKQQEQQQQQQKNSTEWNNDTELKSSTKIDDELQSQGNQLTDSWEPQSLLLDSENQHILPLDLLPSQSAHPSKSTEDLLHASRVPQNICNQASFNNNFHSEGSFPSQNKNEVLSSDSVYPENLNSQENLENSMDNQTHQAPIKYQEYILGVNDNHRDRRRIPLVQKNGPELITFKPSKETYQRHGYDSLPKDTRSHIHFNTKQPNQMINDTSNTKSHNQMRGLATNQNYVNEEELHIFEENDKEKNDKFHKNQKTNSNTEDESEEEIYIETKNKIGGADTLQVRDFQTYAEKEDQNGNSNNVVTFVDLEKEERHKGDGCTSSSSSTSSSWMEWTQQLQAYVAWVNSQLRKMPNKHLITDLRRDFQNGVVFADLIEILAGEKVAGITREADSSQLRRENIDRVLQFMAAKRIRMTHITNKEIMEGNLKSIMRVILALAAHYKPQSVQEGSAAANSQESTRTVTRSENNNNNNNNPEQNKKQEKTSQQTQTQKHMTSTKALTHDVGVGPDTPFSPPDKTPNLIRRKITMIDEKEEQSCLPLRRQPSLANSVRPSSPTAPVYENLPKRSSLNRWAYDSLRASHKFYWASTSDNKSRNQQNSMNVAPKQHSLDDMSEDVFSNSFNTGSSRCSSLNTSVEVDDKDVAFPHGTRGPQNKPAALEFWQDLQSNDRSDSSNKLSSEETEIENPFKYHTIHRISGRRKLPQIPGQSSPSSNNSRGNTPVGSVAFGPSSDLSQGSTAEGDSHVNSLQNRNGNNIDDTSREPEGRSQNSSPATSLVRGPIIESWREMVGIEKSIDDLKDYYKDQLNGRETINSKDRMSVFGLHSLLVSKTSETYSYFLNAILVLLHKL